MPDSSVADIAQTPDGYLWVGTYSGLARFDGVRFVTFDPENTPALAHARVARLTVDDQGTLWIGTFDGSLTSLRQGKFVREWTGSSGMDPEVRLISAVSNQVTFMVPGWFLRRKPQSAPAGTGWEDLIAGNRSVGRSVGRMCVGDGAGTIWFRGADRRLWRVTGRDVEPVPAACGLAGSQVNGLVTDPKGRLWVGTDRAIARWDGTRFQDLTPTNGAWPTNGMLLSVAADGRCWAGVDGQVRQALDRRWLPAAPSSNGMFPGGLTGMNAREDHHGGLWLYSYGRGLAHIAADGQVRPFSQQEGFPGDRVSCFFEDHEGNWWAGLDPGGLVRLCERRFQTLDTGGPVSTTQAKSVCQETNGTLWIGTMGDGLVRWQAGALTNLTVPGGTGQGYAFCVCPDAAGRLWVSAGEQDLYVREAGRFQRVTPVVHGVKVILADPDGGLWVGTKVGLYHGSGDASPHFELCRGFGPHGVRALARDGPGSLWAGTGEGALYHITGGKISAFNPTDSKTPQAVWSLLAEADGTVWAGTAGGGLLRLRAGKFTRFSLHEGLPDSSICQILADGAGNLWLGSHQGIFRVAKAALDDYARGGIKQVPCTVYGRSDGLPSLECSGSFQPAAWRALEGRLWFTTIKGAVSVQPEAIRPNLLPPPVVMEEILIDGKNLAAAVQPPANPVPSGMIYDREKEYLEVPPGKHQFEFRYTGLSLVSSDRVQFRYRLEGADADWVEAGTRRSAQYNLLPPGRYQFRVIACNSDRVWNELGAALTVKIRPHIYETLWFRVLAGLAAGGLVAFGVRHAVTRRLDRQLEQLARQQAVERERARIAKDIHDDLGANLTLIAVLGGLAKQEKAGERIEKMASTARQAVKSLDEIVWAVNPRNDTLAHLIDYTGQFAADYLRAVGIRCRLDVCEPAPPREVSSSLRHNVFLAVKEALQNIVKHARASEVWLRVRATNRGLRVVIEDNGCGFEQAPQDALADGLRNMRQRMQEVNGQCRIQSRVGAGTEIILDVPWSPD
jgi:signal transduction histidine kinase/ligand-binding sensor domain-containing protein